MSECGDENERKFAMDMDSDLVSRPALAADEGTIHSASEFAWATLEPFQKCPNRWILLDGCQAWQLRRAALSPRVGASSM